MKNLIVVLAIALWIITPACDSASGGSCLDPGQVTLGAEQGADLCSGTVTQGSHTTDIWAVDDGGKLSFLSGGESPTHPRPVSWFLSGGGVQLAYDSLEAVPNELPDDVDGLTLKKAKEHGGFVLMRANGTYVKGWFKTLTHSSVVIQFGPLASEP